MDHDRPSKASDDPSKSTVRNAVDRASSATPLDDDSHIDPKTIRDRVHGKREAENKSGTAEPQNPQGRPGPVRATPDRIREDDKGPAPTPGGYRQEVKHLPEQTAKDKVREDMPKDVERIKREVN